MKLLLPIVDPNTSQKGEAVYDTISRKIEVYWSPNTPSYSEMKREVLGDFVVKIIK